MLNQAFMSALLLLGSGQSATEPAIRNQCDFAHVDEMGKLVAAMGERAVDAVRRAAQADWASDDTLAAMVDPKAYVASGGGDVGLPMGKGVSGLRALVQSMRADRYRYEVWSTIPTPIDACLEHKMTVDFIDSSNHGFTRVDFTFLAGHITAAKGWRHFYNEGAIAPVAGSMVTPDFER